MLRALVLGLLFCASCAVPDLTEVVVIIEAEPGIRAQSRSLAVKVTLLPGPGEEGPGVVWLDQSDTPWRGNQYTVALSPESPRVAGRYLVEVSALANTVPIATARLISGFVVGHTRYVRMLLEDRCVGVFSCGPEATCHQGACVGAEVDPAQFSPSDGLAPISGTLPVTTIEPADAAVQSGADAALPNGRDAAPAIATDAGRDAGGPRVTDTGTATRPDATVRADAAVLASVPDAAPLTPDASGPMVPQGALCRPGYYEGTFMGDYSYTLFSMKADTKIQPVSTSNAPVLSLVLVADAADGPSKLRVSAGCMSGTMVAPPSNRPFVARFSGSLDCATGQLTGRLAAVYYVNNTDIDFPSTGAVSAQFDPATSSLHSGLWSAVEPKDPNNISSGMGQGSWSASWTSDSAPSVSVDPCADVVAAP